MRFLPPDHVRDQLRKRPKHPRAHFTITHVWCGELPPWSDELGERRDFTPEEKEAEIVCRPVPRMYDSL